MAFTLGNLKSRLQERHVIYISSRAKSVSFSGKNLVVAEDSGDISLPVTEIYRLAFLGKVQVSSTVIYRLMQHGISIDWLDIFGRPLGVIWPVGQQTPALRIAQEKFCRSPEGLALARRIIGAKMENVAELMRRRKALPPVWYGIRKKAANAASAEQLRGLEGAAARLFFDNFGEWCPAYQWNGRKPHPAPDPVNMLLSVGYGLLHNRLASALRFHGLEPRLGFFHQSRGSHWALASDLMEDIRFAVDSTVLRLVRSTKISPDDFSVKNGRCVFARRDAFRLVLQIFELMFRREWAHVMPGSGGGQNNRITLNDWIDNAAIAFCGHIGKQESYEPFRRRIWDFAW